MSRETLKEFFNNNNISSDKVSYSINQEEGVKSGDDLGVDPNTNIPLILK